MNVKLFSASVLFLSSIYSVHFRLAPYEQWWEDNVNTGYMQLISSIQHYNAHSRILMRRYIQKKGYKNILDVGCGIGTEWIGFKHDHMNIEYQGVDITPSLVHSAQQAGINVIESSIFKIPFLNETFDIAYTRHVLEHLPSYEGAIDELIRVACREVLIIFFIKPHEHNANYINLIPFQGSLLYNNHYSKKKLSEYIHANKRVDYCVWESLNMQEDMLHIYLK